MKSRDKPDPFAIYVNFTFFLIGNNLTTLQTLFINCFHPCAYFAIAGFVITQIEDDLNQVSNFTLAATGKVNLMAIGRLEIVQLVAPALKFKIDQDRGDIL